MAEAALSFAVNTLGDLLIQKVGFLKGVEEQVRQLKSELKYMQCFLKDAAEKQANDERIRTWISDIREVAYDAEDAIEIFVRNAENTRRSSTLLGRWACFPKHLYNRYKVGKEIESILKRLQEIESRRQRYGIQNLGEGTSVLSKRTEDVERRRRLAPWKKDEHLVGVDEAVNSLLENAIMKEREGLYAAAILGMGGSGKSTLARVIFNHPKVKNGRFDYRAWVVASNAFTPEETIKHLIRQLQESTEDRRKVMQTLKEMEESTKDKLLLQEMLQEMLHKHLEGKQYFIIVDDLWERTHWDSLRSAFPDEKDKASRLLFTSRNSIITDREGYIHKMRFLEEDDSWDLLLKTAFIGNIPEHVKCSPDFKKIGGEIFKKCGGLPLAITVVGGLLMNQAEWDSGWERILKGINTYSGRSGLDNISAVLELSYHNLPYELKACFLCLGFCFFREDAAIPAKTLIHIWIAQGLIPLGEGEETMEEIGMSYLDELIDRNMAQVMDVKMDDRVKKCQIHDLIRDLSIRKAKEEISFEIIKEEGDSQSLHKPRHCSMHGRRSIHSPGQSNHLRSLFVHAAEQDVGNLEKSSYWKSFELLKVLDVDGPRFRKLPGTIGALSRLKYLRVRADILPRSFRMLRNLEVLRASRQLAPDVIWKMDSLRHLYSDFIYCAESSKISTLKNIKTLKYISISDSHLEQITKLTSLRTLGLETSRISDGSRLFTSLAKLRNLIHLTIIRRIVGACPLNIDDGLGALISITQLKLVDEKFIRLPSASNFPPNLSYLTLRYTIFNEDPMPVLEKLPKLLYLKLVSAYEGDEMVICNDGFPKLKVLILNDSHLRNIRVGKGAMSRLKRLELFSKTQLDSFAEEMRLKSTDLQVVIHHS